jgi:hypothetical protein
MQTFSIYNMVTGEELGAFVAESETAALDAMAREYSFENYSDVIAQYGIDRETAISELQITVTP